MWPQRASSPVGKKLQYRRCPTSPNAAYVTLFDVSARRSIRSNASPVRTAGIGAVTTRVSLRDCLFVCSCVMIAFDMAGYGGGDTAIRAPQLEHGTPDRATKSGARARWPRLRANVRD